MKAAESFHYIVIIFQVFWIDDFHRFGVGLQKTTTIWCFFIMISF